MPYTEGLDNPIVKAEQLAKEKALANVWYDDKGQIHYHDDHGRR
jgi:hypothetical protein